MEDGRVGFAVRRDFARVLPETLEEAEELAASIEREIAADRTPHAPRDAAVCTPHAPREVCLLDRQSADLAASIERAVQRETDWGVAELVVEVGSQGVLLRGRCDTYYTKQLAQHAAMRIPGGDRLINSIEVL
jgi:hypothetical protein